MQRAGLATPDPLHGPGFSSANSAQVDELEGACRERESWRGKSQTKLGKWLLRLVQLLRKANLTHRPVECWHLQQPAKAFVQNTTTT